jgi:cobalt transporter subunit CbtB
MEKTATRTATWALPEQISFFLKSSVFLLACGAILYVALASEYPAIHDALHNARHALAVVPCH